MAGNTSYLVTNKITSSMLSSLTADSSYPVSNLLDKEMDKVYRSTSTSSEVISVDFGEDVTIDTIFLGNHNLLEATGSMVVEGDTTSSPTTVRASPAWRLYDIFVFLNPALTLRYWDIVLADTNTAVLQAGQLIMGESVAFPRRYSHAHQKKLFHGDIHLETNRLKVHNYSLADRRSFEYVFVPLTEAEAGEFDTYDIAVDGRGTPHLFIPDDTGTDAYYVRKQSESVQEGADSSFFSYRVRVDEESRGVEILA